MINILVNGEIVVVTFLGKLIIIKKVMELPYFT